MNIIIQKSEKSDKKITAIINDKKTIHFGDDRYEDYIMHKNETRKKSYLARHKNDNFTNPLYPSFYSTSLLWSKSTLKEAIQATNKRYKCKYQV